MRVRVRPSPHAVEYIGCFLNDGVNRRTGHVTNVNWGGCLRVAEQAETLFFGMEWPQGFGTEGYAECLSFETLPPMNKIEDERICEGEPMVDGKRLGSGHRIAIYKRPCE